MQPQTGWRERARPTPYWLSPLKTALWSYQLLRLKRIWCLCRLHLSIPLVKNLGLIVTRAASGSMFQTPSPPTATVSDLNLSNVGTNLGALGGFGINELVPAFAYLWEASGQNVPRYGIDGNYSGQLWTFQSLSDKNPPQSGLKFSGYGYVETACLAVPPVTMTNPLADGFLLEPNVNPNVPSTDMYLRALSLQPNQ